MTVQRDKFEQIKQQLLKLNLQCSYYDNMFSDLDILARRTVNTKNLNGDYTDKNGNRIIFLGSIPRNCSFTFYGCNNRIVFGDQVCVQENAEIQILLGDILFCSNAYIFIDNYIIVQNKLFVHAFSNTSCEILYNTSILELSIFVSEKGMVKIGKDCLFSAGVTLFQSDRHHIFDKRTGKRINSAKDIIIGNHVWVGRNVTLLPGASISTGCMIGYNSITSSCFPPHTLLAGSPAKILRREICWAKDCTEAGYGQIEDCNDPAALAIYNNTYEEE